MGLPRPPAVVDSSERVRVEIMDKTVLAESKTTIRVLETAGAPCYYIPPQDVKRELLEKAPTATFCEWKGTATYWYIKGSNPKELAVFSYEAPLAGFERIKGYLGFLPGKFRCFVDDELVMPQPGGFYAGWMTSRIAGPVKGNPGTEWW